MYVSLKSYPRTYRNLYIVISYEIKTFILLFNCVEEKENDDKDDEEYLYNK